MPELHLAQYVPALEKITNLRLLHQVSRVYQTIKIEKLSQMIPFFDFLAVEKISVDAVKHGFIALKVDRARSAAIFGTQCLNIMLQTQRRQRDTERKKLYYLLEEDKRQQRILEEEEASKREEAERRRKEEAERRRKEEAERKAKLDELAEKQRQRERELDEKERLWKESILRKPAEPPRPVEPPLPAEPVALTSATAAPTSGKYLLRHKRVANEKCHRNCSSGGN